MVIWLPHFPFGFGPRPFQARQAADRGGSNVLFHGTGQHADDKDDDQAVGGNGEFDQHGRFREIAMPARKAPFSIASNPLSSGTASRRTVSV